MMRVLDTAVINLEENGQNKPPTLNFPSKEREVKRGRLRIVVTFSSLGLLGFEHMLILKCLS